MTNAKSTRRAMLSSAIAVIMCVAMLIGTTFAWFTDTASTAVNKIQAGTLDIQLIDEDGNDLEGTTLEFKKSADAPTGEAILWEPGCTYELPAIKIKNNGNLALKYKVQITGLDGDAKLLEAIEWTIGGVALDTELHLAAGATSEALTITGHMKDDAGNEYQGLSIDGIAITVVATQDKVEYDSNDNQYDNDATYPAADQTELATLLNSGKIVTLGKDIAPTETITVSGVESTLDLNGKTVANTADIWEHDGSDDWSLVSAQNGANLTITGNGTFAAKANDCYAVDVQDGSTVTIKNGTFAGNIHAVYVLKGTAIIEGGFYSVQQKYPDSATADEFVLNCYDANRANGSAKIIVKGGTFVNFNPADCQAEGAGTNFVADGYRVVSETQANGDVWYTVVAE